MKLIDGYSSGLRLSIGALAFLVLMACHQMPIYATVQDDWDQRVLEANQSDLNGKTTRNQSNDRLIEIARQYFYKPDAVIYLNASRVQQTDSKLKEIRFDPAWFTAHAPVGIDYGARAKYAVEYYIDRYIVSWRFMPGCEKRHDNKLLHPKWFDSRGFQCEGGSNVSVLLTQDLKPERIDVLGRH
jgi:hypothetical protein